MNNYIKIRLYLITHLLYLITQNLALDFKVLHISLKTNLDFGLILKIYQENGLDIQKQEFLDTK